MEYYSHTIRITNFDYVDISRIEKIMKSGYIYSRRNLKDTLGIKGIDINEDTSLFNGMDYISLCDLSKKHERYSAYYMYVYRGLSFLFNKGIDVIKPTVVNTSTRDLNFFERAHNYGMCKERYSDLYDEVQLKDKLSFDNLEGLSLSLKRMRLYHNKDYMLKYLNALKELLLQNKKNVPIINLDTEKELLVEKRCIINR